MKGEYSIMGLRNALIPMRGMDDMLAILENAQNRMFNAVKSCDIVHSVGYPKMDVYQGEDEFVVTAAVPGLNRDEIDIKVEQVSNRKLLVISGKKASRFQDRNKDRYVHKELHLSTWTRSLEITGIDDKDITSVLENGLLTIHIPVKQEKKEDCCRHIDIN